MDIKTEKTTDEDILEKDFPLASINRFLWQYAVFFTKRHIGDGGNITIVFE